MYKETKPPCYKCGKRHSNCHSTCPEYCDWQKERQEMLEERRKAQDLSRKLTDAEIQRHLKIKHKKKNKRSFGK